MKHGVYAQSIFYKIFKFETKRYYTNVSLLIIACIVPILLIMSLLGSLLPILFRGAELNNVNIALFNEDQSFETNMIIRHLTESESVEEFVNVVDADSLSEGKKMLEENEASALIHIPENLQENLYQGKSQTLYFYTGNTNKQIVNLIYDMLKGGLNNINQAQKSVDIIYYAMQDMGYERVEAAQEYSKTAELLFVSIISRSDVFEGYTEASATGDYLNIEYYLISTLLLCLFFLGLPICANLSKDKLSGVMDRGGFYLNGFQYVAAKTLSGSLFLLLPASISVVFILTVSGGFGLFSGSAGLVVITSLLAVLYISSIMILIGAFARSTTSGIWIGFSTAIIVSAVSGLFIPRNLMPREIVSIAEVTGLPSVIRLYGASLFGVRNFNMYFDIVIVLIVSMAAFFVGYIKTKKWTGKS